MFARTDPRFVEKLLNNIQLPNDLTAYFSKTDKVIVSSLERFAHKEFDAQIITDRWLIGKLLQNNTMVLDRDEHTIALCLGEKRSNISPSKQSNVQLNDSGLSASFIWNGTAGTKTLAYRILELGIGKVNSPDGKTVRRIGNTDLELRLINTETTQILYSGVVSANYEDTLTTAELAIVSGLHLSFENDALPLSKTYKAKEMLDQIKTGAVSAITKNQIDSIIFKLDIISISKVLIKSTSGETVFSKTLDPKMVVDDKHRTIFYEQTIVWDLKDKSGQYVLPGEYSVLLNNETVKEFTVE